ncbi:hypothetical protein KQX54_013089 [Cotesia glomerata]|uniref:Uncharacterized protein n=1 Tax=Cotesia glomerata TaxID=32391 RepID=A0AAV7IYF7_COTGL|nr:hypothetical protein KQX54_013089 [Cotesia glomerata]
MVFSTNGIPSTQNSYPRKQFQPTSGQGQYRTPYRAYGNRQYQTPYQQGGYYQPYRPQSYPTHSGQLHPTPAIPRKQQTMQGYPQGTPETLPANPVTEAIHPQSPQEDQEPAPILPETLLLPASGTDTEAPAKKRGRPPGSRNNRVQSLPVIRDTIASRLRSELRRGSQNPPITYREPESTENGSEQDTPADSDDVFLPPNKGGGKSGRVEIPKDPVRELAPATYFDSGDDGDDDEEEGGELIDPINETNPIQNTSQNIDTTRTSVNESIEKFERIAKKFGNVRGVAPDWIRGSTKPANPLTAYPQWVQFPKTPPSEEIIREVRRSLTTPFHRLDVVSDEEEDRTLITPTNPDSSTDDSENGNEVTELISEGNDGENDDTSTASEPDDTVIPTEIGESSLPSSVPVPEENIRLAPETPTLIRSMLKNFEAQGIQWDPSSGKIIDISTHQGSTPYRPFADETVIAQRRDRLSELPTFNINDNPEACSSVMEDNASPNQTTTVPRAKKRVTFGEPSTSEQPVPAIKNPQQKPNSSTESPSDTSETPVQLTNQMTIHKNSTITPTTTEQQAEINLPPSEPSSSEEELRKRYTTPAEIPIAEPKSTSAIKFLSSRDGLTYRNGSNT